MTLRIGSAQGYYGDDVTRALPMIRGGHVDVVCFEALAELTLAILQKDRLKDPTRGYTSDIMTIATTILPEAYQRKIPLITNGGGLNPQGAAELVHQIATEKGLHGLKIAAVIGDDFTSRLPELAASLRHMETGQTLQLDFARVVNANVYLGTAPIVEALKNGADIVITGRVADPCLYLAPMIAYYGWDWDAWDKLASGIVAGHLLECTAQVVGGNSLAVMDDITPEDLPDLGYPIAHIDEDGSFILTKTPDSPGIVNVNTVKEQLLYEVHDPANYITPDVIADFTTLRLAEVGKDQMRVTNVTGKPRPDKLKLHISQHEGYMRELIFTLSYPEAWRKVDQLKRMIASSWQNLAIDRVEYSYLGQNSLFGSLTALPDDPLEVIVRVMFTAQDDGILQTGVRRLMQNGLSGPAGMSVSGTTISGKPRAILGLSPTLIDRELVNPQIKYIEV